MIVFLALVGTVAIDHTTDTPSNPVTVTMPVVMADSSVALWTAPAYHPVALADAISAPVLTSDLGVPVTDTGGSANGTARAVDSALRFNDTGRDNILAIRNVDYDAAIRHYSELTNPTVTDPYT